MINQKFSEIERKKIISLAQESLWSKDGESQLNHLKNNRHISEEVLKKFKVGYCPRESGYQLAGRIIMPLYNSYGEEIAVTTRDFENKDFSHWHESFDKGQYLYGLDVAKESIRRNDKCIIVEGQFDTMVFHSYGLTMTVCIMGTSFTLMQVSLLARYCSDMFIILDPDKAGKDSAERIKTMYEQNYLKNFGINFIYVELPDGLDPDDYLVKYGKQGLFTLMKEAKERILNG